MWDVSIVVECIYKWCVLVVNARVIWKGLELLSVNDGSFEINLMLFTDDAALVTNSEKMLCRRVG